MKLICLSICLFLQLEPTNNDNTTLVYFSKLTQNCRESGAKQEITTDCRMKIIIDVILFHLYNFVSKYLGSFAGGEESFQKILI